GLNTSAIYGFTATLEEILRTQSPTHLGVVFDPPGPTFRHEKYPEYKANREATPEEIKNSVPWIKKILRAFNIPVIEVEGYEADDVIGTLASIADSRGFRVYMMTPDKDFTQLVSDNVFMFKPRRSGNEAEIIGVDEVKDIFSVDDPKQVIDVLALWGDSSDNIPGAPGIGEKTAKKLISAYKSIENIFEHKDELKGKILESITQNQDQIRLSKELATIRLDVPVEFNEKELVVEGAKKEDLISLFKDLEFKTLASRVLSGIKPMDGQDVESSSGESIPGVSSADLGDLFGNSQVSDTQLSHLKSLKDVEHQYFCVDTPDKIQKLAGSLKELRAFCFDTETTDINALEAELVGIAFAWEPGNGWYVPIPAERDEAIKILEVFRKIFENEGALKVGQNLKYDIQVLSNYGIVSKGPFFDTMIAHYLLQPEQKHGLDFLAEAYLGYRNIPTEELIGKKGGKQSSMRDVPLVRICDYACEDADITWQLYLVISQEILKMGLEELSSNIEFPLISVLCRMEKAGIRLNSESLDKYAKILESELLVLRDSIYDLAGVEFNISSPKQMGEILFE
ncbi:MAG: DNA polymerase I, partial [Bacteroidales bacterium]|nr:DNA polymerase I [Bacteroidales bacterium]